VARRSARKAKTKPAKPAKTAKPKRAKGRRGGDDFEVTDQADARAGSGWSLESGLVLVTFLALIVSFALIQIEMSGAYGTTWPF
jgi:hypothetical protein